MKADLKFIFPCMHKVWYTCNFEFQFQSFEFPQKTIFDRENNERTSAPSAATPPPPYELRPCYWRQYKVFANSAKE